MEYDESNMSFGLTRAFKWRIESVYPRSTTEMEKNVVKNSGAATFNIHALDTKLGNQLREDSWVALDQTPLRSMLNDRERKDTSAPE